jgi:type II secretory pathway pseudopilin PulG
MNGFRFEVRRGGSFRRGRAAFTLLETLVAVGVFGMAALGLLAALGGTVEAARSVQRQAQVRNEMENLLAGLSLGPFVEGQTNVTLNGVDYRKEIVREELQNEDKLILPGYWRVRVTARWKEAGQPQEWVASHLEFRP